MNFINRYLLSLLVISFASITNHTFAQDESEAAIEEVIVTATKRETNLMETPIAVSVVSQDQLNTQGIARISDLSNLVPNMQVGTSAEDSGVNIAIRGIGSNNYTEIGDPTVAVHVDGMYSPRPQAALMLAHDVERIEILRGPQGTLFGRNSTSGAINVVTARPQFGDEVTGRYGVRLGNRHTQEIDGFINVPITSEWAMRTSFKASKANSYIDQTVDSYDWELDYNRDGKIGVNTSGPGNPDQSTVTWADGRDVMKDGIANVDQRRAREVKAADAYGNTNNWAGRFGFLFAPADNLDLEWYVSLDHFQDDGAGNIYLKDCEQAEMSRGMAYDFSCDQGPDDPFHAAINNPGELDFGITSLRSELKFRVNEGVLGELRISISEQDRYQINDNDGGNFVDPSHPAYGFKRDHPDSMMTNWNALRGHHDCGGIYGCQYGWGPKVEGSNGTGFNGDAYFQNTAWSMGYDNCQMGWGGSVEASFAYGCQYSVWMQDFDAVAAALGLVPGEAAAILAANVRPMWFDEMSRTTQEMSSNVVEFQLKSDTDDQLQWVAGVFYMDEDNSSRYDVEQPFNGVTMRPFAASYYQPNRTVESMAIFGQMDYAVDDRLNITFGYRHTWDEKQDVGGKTIITHGYYTNPNMYCADANDCFWFESYDFVGNTRLVSDAGGNLTFVDWSVYNGVYQSDDLGMNDGIYNPNFLDIPANADNSYAAEWDAGTYKLGFDYIVNDDLFVYGSLATGFKAGGFGDNVDRGDGVFINFPYEPEDNTTFELGFKASLLGGDLKLLGNAFVSQYENMQRTMFGFVGYDEQNGNAIYTLMTKNLEETTIQGLELEFDWNAWENGRVYGWVAALDAPQPGGSEDFADGYLCLERALLGQDPCAAAGDHNLDGKNLMWSPEVSATVTVEHTFYPASGWFVRPNLSISHTGEMFFNETNYAVAPFHSGQEATTTANAAVTLVNETEAWGLEFYVFNLTDELIKTDSFAGNAGYVRAMYAPPRAFGFRFQKDF